jgi:hypothetical protein
MKNVACLFMLLTLGSFAQETFLGHQIHFTPKTFPKNDFNIESYYQSLISKYTTIIKKQNELHEFASALTESKNYYVNSNTEYENMPEAVAYLEKIISKLEFEKQLNLQIRIIRDPSINACAFEDGTIYVNIGLLAKYKTEAQIAAILGHEFGHILKQHAYNSYATKKEYFKSTYYSPYTPHSSLLGTVIKTKQLSSRLISQEEESDEIATQALIKSNYNSMALSQCFNLFSALDLKYRSSIDGYDGSSLLYLRTHPSSDKRKAKALQITNNSGKNFLIDSVYFFKLKQQAIDESINLLFENQDFEECLEMAFVEHLKKPNDPYYLFYLTECIRRSMAYDKDYHAYAFITSNYQASFNNKPYTEGKNLVKNKNEITPTKKGKHYLLYNLVGPMLLTDSSDYQTFIAKDLLNEDTLDFFTNGDALNYFKEKNKRLNFSLNNLFFGENCLGNQTEREKHYCNLPEQTKAYLEKPKNKKYLYILYDVDHLVTEKNGIYSNTQFSMIFDTYKTIYANVKSYNTEKDIYNDSILNFSERNHLYDYLKLIYPLIKNQSIKKPNGRDIFKALGGADISQKFITRDTANFKSSVIAPELVDILNHNDLDGIIFSAVSIEESSSSSMYGDSNMKTWTVKHFLMDAKSEKVKFYTSASCMYATNSMGFGGTKFVDLPKCYYDTLRDLLRQ